ncbi:MAG: hypothetical protein KA419_10790 [Acidobacteria bacterium]|nr:hypothetical protein [Acidobacteriota bacterium]
MAETWLQPGESILGQWSVFVGDPSPNSAKITGKLYLTNAAVHFQAGLSLEENAATLINRAFLRLSHAQPFRTLDDHLVIPFGGIGDAAVLKRSFFQKALEIRLKSGETLLFQFGIMSPRKAAEGIRARL